MQVYELMNKLKDCPAGAEVRIDTLVKDSDLEPYDPDDTRKVYFVPVNGVEDCGHYIGLS